MVRRTDTKTWQPTVGQLASMRMCAETTIDTNVDYSSPWRGSYNLTWLTEEMAQTTRASTERTPPSGEKQQQKCKK